MRYLAAAQWLAAFWLLLPIGAGNAQTDAASAGQDEHPLLPSGEGRDLMIRTCSQCHDPDRAAKERRSFADFQALMVEMQGNGLQAPDTDLDTIARYLANAFPPSLPLLAEPAKK
jgi:mono/diheme cytochrome c family protein